MRGLDALAVLGYHYTSWYSQTYGGHTPPGAALVFPYGNFGVELFFIISGFVIFMTLERRPSAGDFLVARFARLWPTFAAAVALTLLVSAAFDETEALRDPLRVALNLTMMPEWFDARTIDGSYWSLAFEVDFYLLAALVWFTLRPSAPEPVCLVWLLLGLGLRLWGDPTVTVVRLTNAPFCQLFVIGIMLHRIHSDRVTVANGVVLALALGMTVFGPQSALTPLPAGGYSLLIASFAALVLGGAHPRAGRFVPRPLRFLGRVSYPLYLIHQEAGMIVIAAGGDWRFCQRGVGDHDVVGDPRRLGDLHDDRVSGAGLAAWVVSGLEVRYGTADGG